MAVADDRAAGCVRSQWWCVGCCEWRVTSAVSVPRAPKEFSSFCRAIGNVWGAAGVRRKVKQGDRLCLTRGEDGELRHFESDGRTPKTPGLDGVAFRPLRMSPSKMRLLARHVHATDGMDMPCRARERLAGVNI